MVIQPTSADLLVLAYHRIGDPPPGRWNDWFYVAERTFTEHLDVLDEAGWTFIDLPQLLKGIDDPTGLPRRSILLTFDDADVTLLTGVRHLARRGIPAIVFVPTDFVGATNAIDGDDQPPERICSWSDLHELALQRISIQAHAASHRRFSDLSPSQIRRELQSSKQVLEDRLDRLVEALAYPYGDIGRAATLTERMLAKLGYQVAFLYGGNHRSRITGSCRFRVARLAVGRDTDLEAELWPPLGVRK
jgi:peptidoglycan/xylan/chitin deacetylase (PgdA/CDA1 family)